MVRLHNHGSNHVGDPGTDDPGYSRHAYSTRTGPTSAPDPADNHFALLDADGRATRRGPVTPLGSGPDRALSRHTPLPGVHVVSAVLVHGRAEVRAHLVLGAPEGTPVRQTGWTVHPDGPVSQLHPVHGYAPEVTELPTGGTLQGPAPTRTPALNGTTSGPAALFVALASLTAEADPAPVPDLANVQVSDARTLHVTWQNGTTSRLALDAPEPEDQ